MKATVRKIKDNEWIAEVEGKGKKPFQNIEDYPIVSPSDIEYLEKNNMDGKEVEGDTIISNIYGEKIEPLFELSTPPIHPNPHTENLQYGLAFADKVKELSDPGEENLLDEYWNWKHCDNNEDIISDKKYLSLTKDQQKYYRRWATNKAVGEHIQEINTPIHSDPAGEEGNNLIANLTAILGAVETVGWGGGDQGMALQRISKYAHEAMRSAKGVKPPTPHSDPAGEENLDRDFIAELVLKWYDPALYPNLTPVEHKIIDCKEYYKKNEQAYKNVKYTARERKIIQEWIHESKIDKFSRSTHPNEIDFICPDCGYPNNGHGLSSEDKQQPSTPHTGRTYTEVERNQFTADVIHWAWPEACSNGEELEALINEYLNQTP